MLGKWGFSVLIRISGGFLGVALGLTSALAQTHAISPEEMASYTRIGFKEEYVKKHYARLSQTSLLDQTKLSWQLGTHITREATAFYLEFWPKDVPLSHLEKLYDYAAKHGGGYLWPPDALKNARTSLPLLEAYLKATIDFETALPLARAKIPVSSVTPYWAQKAIRELKTIYKPELLLKAIKLGTPPQVLAQYDAFYLADYDVEYVLSAKVPPRYANTYLKHRTVREDQKLVGHPAPEGVASVWQQAIQEWDLPKILPKAEQTICTLYSPFSTDLVPYTALKFSPDEDANPVPLQILEAIESPLHGTHSVSAADLEAFGREFEKVIDTKAIHKMPLPKLLRYLSDVVGARVNYEDEIDDFKKNPELKNCPLKDYWDSGRADCDKYAALFRVAFAYAKTLMPFSLRNVYAVEAMATSRFRGDLLTHEWVTIVQVGKSRLTITMIDPTFADNGGAFDAMNDRHINQARFKKDLFSGCLDLKLKP